MTKPLSRFTPERYDGTAPRCPCCGCDAARTAFPALEAGFSVLRCPDCGLGRTWPAPSLAEIEKYYPPTYYGKENVRFNPFFEAMTRLFQRRRARVLHNRVPRGPVLDIGCGRGFLLSYLRTLGYEPHGMEFSDTAAWHARNRLKLDVLTGDFLTSPHQKERFNGVVFWHSLEHFSHPVEALARARELLRPGGLVAIAVPNSDSLQARFFGRYWFHLDVPRHYYHFGTGALEALLTRQRFRIVQLDHFCLEQNPYGWLQSFYNALGFKENFLYSLLKTETARTLNIRQHPIQTLLTVLLLPPLLALSLAMTLAEAAVGRGGTIELYAIKE
ncbi:MAG: class I SAM-dependent methyltransferase [Elusimicrobiota bacterium]